MLLENIDTAFRQDADRTVCHDIDIRVRDGRIAAIGPNLDATGTERVRDCSDQIALPGFVNCHSHTPQILLRGFSDDEPLFDWLDTNDELLATLDREQKRAGATLSAALMLVTGTTTVNDMWNTDVAESLADVGIRSLVGKLLAAAPDTDPDVIDAGLDANRTFAEGYADHPTIHPTVPVHSIYRATPELLDRAHDLAATADLPFHIHISETDRENEDCLDERGVTPTGWLDDLGVLDDRAVLAHCTHLTDRDRDRLADSGAGVAHCPAANLKLGSGIADIAALDDVPVGFGTDSAASNNSLNLVREARTGTLLQKREDPSALTAQRALDMLTCEAARVLGMADEIGSLAVGKRADITLLDATDPTLRPHFGDAGLLSNLVYSFHGRAESVLVEGEVVVEDGAVVADVEAAMETAQEFAESVEMG